MCGSHNYGSRSPNKRRSMSRSVPDDIIFIILLCLSAEVIYHVMRFICRQWYNIIRSPIFISSHLQNSTTYNGLLVHEHWDNTFCSTEYFIKPRSVRGRNGVLHVQELYFQPVEKVLASCNGLVFVVGPKETFVANPLTKQYLPLPQLIPVKLDRSICGFAYAASSKVYKVMRFIANGSKCCILSVGLDKAWREVDITHLSSRRVYSCLSLRGFLYCVCNSDPFILSFDIETETFGKIPLPPQCPPQYYYRPTYNGLLAMESSLCLWLKSSENKYLFDFWLLKDPESGNEEWEKLLDIDIEGQGRLRPIRDIKPLGWLRSMELLVFGTNESFIVYNINTEKVHQTKEMKSKHSMRYSCHLNFHAHVDSLVPLHNLSLAMPAT